MQWHVPVVEIFGSTELGSVASRRTASDDYWNLYPGVSLLRQERGLLVDAAYLPHQPLLDDSIEVSREHPDRFRLLGRASDLIKVGGKRASLMALNNQLLDIPGVIDGVFVMPDTKAENTRLCALVVAPELSRKALLDALGEWLDPVFLPRPLYFVECLPRGRSGKLPQAEVLTMLKQLQQKPKISIDSITCVPVDHPALPGHFPGKPVIPGVVLLDLLQASFAEHFPQHWISQIPRLKFSHQLEPGQQCRLLIESDSHQGSFKLLNLSGDAIVSGRFKCNDVVPTDLAACRV
jgi:3-hydroxymyristoyl/3-hydroxydecanoyl-(acyl carrier protein) dehydratase